MVSTSQWPLIYALGGSYTRGVAISDLLVGEQACRWERRLNPTPRAMVMWLVIMMQPVSTIQSQSQNIPAPS
jgi:hypothetical protein